MEKPTFYDNGSNNSPLAMSQDALLSEIKRNTIFRLLFSGEKLSQSSLSRKLKINKSTMSFIIKELKTAGVIKEGHLGKSGKKGGKPPLMLEIDEKNLYIAAVKIESFPTRATL
jgi:DNA-binding Lrp family transcriptional regulator